MKLKHTLITLAALTALHTTAQAQYIGTLPPVLDFTASYTTDSDKFDTIGGSAGFVLGSGFGAKVEYQNYSSPTVSGNSSSLFGTYSIVTDNLNLTAAIGVRNISHSTNPATLDTTALQKLSDQGGTADGSDQVIVGSAEATLVMTDRLTLGAYAAKDIVDSAAGLQSNVTSTTLAISSDLVLTETVDWSASLGNTYYSDSNVRTFLKNRVSWTILPDAGVSLFGKIDYHTNTNPGSPYYTSPENATSTMVGAQWRKTYNGLTYSATLGAGNVTEHFLYDYTASGAVYEWNLGVQTSPGRKTGTTYGVVLVGVNKDSYSWKGVYAWLKVPF